MTLIVTTRHLLTVPGFSRRRGFCRAGAKQWCARHEIDWRRFVRDGIPAATLEATRDPLALAVVAWARECARREACDGLE